MIAFSATLFKEDSSIKAHLPGFLCRHLLMVVILFSLLVDARAETLMKYHVTGVERCHDQPPDDNREALEEPGSARSETSEQSAPSNVTGEGIEDEASGRSLRDHAQAATDTSAEENEESIRDAFVHSPEELDELTVPVEFKDAVDHYIAYFTTKKRKMFVSWLRRAKRYTPLLKKILSEHDLPEDLVYLAMIESGFNPKAYSPMAACGPWQFISATGQRYGLRIDHWVDERRDFEKATVAAARYLKDLFGRFDCWYLAASGYNAGEGRIEQAIRRYNTTDYWELYRYNTLPRETRQYIPQLIAAATISEDPERYGFADADPEEPPLEYQKKKVPGGTPLYVLAEASLSDLSEIKALNPELMTRITPPGKDRYVVKLPAGASLEGFDATLESRLRGKRVVGTVKLTSLRRRSLTRALKHYGATREDLALVNRGDIRASHQRVVYIPLFERKRGAAQEGLSTHTETGKIRPGKYRVAKTKKKARSYAKMEAGYSKKMTLRAKGLKKKGFSAPRRVARTSNKSAYTATRKIGPVKGARANRTKGQVTHNRIER